MQKICSSLTLITTNESVIDRYRELQSKYDFELKVEDEWCTAMNSTSDSVVCTIDCCGRINKVLAQRTYVYLEDTKMSTVPDEFSHFVDESCIKYSLISTRKPKLGSNESKEEYREVFSCGDYYFDFDNDVFMWKGQELYLRKSEASFLNAYLIRHEVNKERMNLISYIRKRVGKDFLRDVSIMQ